LNQHASQSNATGDTDEDDALDVGGLLGAHDQHPNHAAARSCWWRNGSDVKCDVLTPPFGFLSFQEKKKKGKNPPTIFWRTN